MPRHGRKVTVLDLQSAYRPLGDGAAAVLCCRRCGGRYSANPHDYFWARYDEPMKCCNVNLFLVSQGGQ